MNWIHKIWWYLASCEFLLCQVESCPDAVRWTSSRCLSFFLLHSTTLILLHKPITYTFISLCGGDTKDEHLLGRIAIAINLTSNIVDLPIPGKVLWWFLSEPLRHGPDLRTMRWLKMRFLKSTNLIVGKCRAKWSRLPSRHTRMKNGRFPLIS